MSPYHVVVIDDDEFNLKVLAQLLHQEGATHTDIKDAHQVEAVVSSLPHIDLVLLDLEMPYMDGFELIRLLREILGDQTPIVACSVHTNELDNVFQAGFHGFLGKPLDLQRFPSQFARMMSGEAVWEIE